MKALINGVLEDAFERFQREIKSSSGLCELKKVRFDGQHVPPYELQIARLLYILRYFPAYAIEYYDIYLSLLRQSFLPFPYKVLSIGSGCGVDFFSLYYACRKKGFDPSELSYKGVDKIDWEYRDKVRIPDITFLNQDVGSWKALDKDDYSLVVFPKSIGEFSQKTFGLLKKAIAKTSFSEDKICIVNSLRDKRDGEDTRRAGELADILENIHGYEALDDSKEYYYYKKEKALRCMYPVEFDHSDEIIEYVNSLSSKCPKFKKNAKNCKLDCKGMLNKKPILYNKYIKYQILRFER